jgi:hypothetical protein
MIPCGPIKNNLPKSALQFALNFTAVVVLATPAFAQAVPKYDAATETILKVAVQELKFVPPTGAKPAAYLMTKSGSDAVQIFLCPKSFLDAIGAEFKAGDEIQVTGSKVKQDGADLILAREVVKAGDTLTFRFKDGKPAW